MSQGSVGCRLLRYCRSGDPPGLGAHLAAAAARYAPEKHRADGHVTGVANGRGTRKDLPSDCGEGRAIQEGWNVCDGVARSHGISEQADIAAKRALEKVLERTWERVMTLPAHRKAWGARRP